MDSNNNKIETLAIYNGPKSIFDLGAHYVIPRYQRAFTWEDNEINQLIDDINDIEDSPNYYIGSLIVAKIGDNKFEVIDGQQRLTTLYLLLHYLFKDNISTDTLTFDCRERSNHTLKEIKKVVSNPTDTDEQFEQSILNGIKVIHSKFKSLDKDNTIDNFIKKLKRVILYRIEVPENTDLNRYFEIMNTRGEQLEQHDILKAKLMGFLDDDERSIFAKIWDACSDMTGYVQMHFAPEERAQLFGSNWNDFPAKELDGYKQSFNINDSNSGSSPTINEIIANDFSIDIVDGANKDNNPIRFESIIDFPYFLLNSLRVFVHINNNNKLNTQLDDKKLITDFDKVLGALKTDDDKKNFSRKFIVHLLKSRYLFDKFIIKREYTGDDNIGKWSLQELSAACHKSRRTPNYTNTKLMYAKELEDSYSPQNKKCLMIQSALRVSYTSPKVMHWITDLLTWLFSSGNEAPELITKVERIAANAVKSYLENENFNLGTQTPHFVFNLLDYILWKNDKKVYNDFVFEFRNSVEHWYPQNPSEGTIDKWKDKDRFGNLCIISRSVNSKFSNLSPESKMKTFGNTIKKGSIKLRIMGKLIDECHNDGWKNNGCENHEKEMIKKLQDFCQQYYTDICN